MKEVFFASSYPDRIAYILDEAEMMTRLGHECTIITCNRNIRRCNANMTCNSVQCMFCERYTKKLLSKCSSSITVRCLDSFMSQQIMDTVDGLSFNYNSVDDIKKIKYHDANVGYGSLSLYISLTRNLSPLINDSFKKYFDNLLRDTCLMAALQEKAIKETHADRVTLFNGRFPEVRGALDYAMANNIDLKVCEYTRVYPDLYLKRYFYNSLPHSMSYNHEMITSLWESSSISDRDKDSFGRWFFESKREQKFFGDKNYVGGQDTTALPSDWSEERSNYVIFNSSEDEFVAISDEYENAKLFNSQYEGIRHIAEILQDNSNVHIYLRVHPNLKDIKYHYHTQLLKLGEKYPNLTVIPGNSKVSSYSLLSNADKVIVFGSTIGIEAAYAGKPVINLRKCYYSRLNSTYEPTSIKEADSMILAKDLKAKPKDGAIKFGLYYMNPYGSSYTFFNNNFKYFVFLGRILKAYPHAKFLGSTKLYAIITRVLFSFTHKTDCPREEYVLNSD